MYFYVQEEVRVHGRGLGQMYFCLHVHQRCFWYMYIDMSYKGLLFLYYKFHDIKNISYQGSWDIHGSVF